MIAKQKETFRWIPFTRYRGFTIDTLPGMFVINLDDAKNSIEKELTRYFNTYVWRKAGEEKTVSIGSWIPPHKLSSGTDAQYTPELTSAIRQALSVEIYNLYKIEVK